MLRRSDLVEKFDIIAPALGVNSIIPILQHLWFTGDRLLAYNDQIAISLPFKSDFKGAVPNTLIGLLKASKAAGVEFGSVDDDGILPIKAGGSKFKLATMPPQDFIFKMPKVSVNSILVSGKRFDELVGMIERCMRSLGNDPSVPELNGVSLISVGDQVHIYASNHTTLSHARARSGGDARFERAIFSGPFCKQLVALSKRPFDRVSLAIENDFAYATFDDVELWGSLIRSDQVLVDFPDVLRRNFPDFENQKRLVPIPRELGLMVDRAIIVAESRLEPIKTTITVRDGTGFFQSSSDRGQVKDAASFENHPDISVQIEPKLIKIGLDGADGMLITGTAIILANRKYAYLISVA